jgi:hypothetical protein
MTATTAPSGEPLAGAASHEPTDWQAIDWLQVHRNVRRLQRRIVKATQDGRWGKVKALQRLLTHSFSGKALAVRRVTENQGKRTPGVDGITWDTPEQKATAITRLRQRGYQPQPLKRVYIPKRNGKLRPLGIPMMRSYCLSLQEISGMPPGAAWHGEDGSSTLLYSTTHVDYCAGGRWFQCRRTGLRKVSMFSGVSVIQRGPCGMARTASNLPCWHHWAMVETSTLSRSAAPRAE